MLTYFPESTVSSTVNTANNSPRASFQALPGDDSDPSDISQTFSMPMDLIMGGLVGTRGSHLEGTMSMWESLNPSATPNLGDNAVGEEPDSYDTDLEKVELSAFIDLGTDSADGDDNDDDTEGVVSPTTPMASQQGDENNRHSVTQSLLEHFDRGVVSSFRSNQDRHRHLSRLAQHPSERVSASRAVRTGRSAETLITPVRRRRTNSIAAAAATGSPLARRRSGAANVAAS